MVSPSCNSPDVPPSGPERRKHVRYSLGKAVCGHIIINDQETIVPEIIQNISAGGVRVLLSGPLEPNTQPILELYNVENNYSFKQPIRVAYVANEAGGNFGVGGVFTRVLGTVEVEKFI
jgi:hypothetical protein